MCFGITCHPVAQQENLNAITGLKIYILDINFSLTEHESCSWDYWSQVVTVYSELCEPRTKSDGGPVFPSTAQESQVRQQFVISHSDQDCQVFKTKSSLPMTGNNPYGYKVATKKALTNRNAQIYLEVTLPYDNNDNDSDIDNDKL